MASDLKLDLVMRASQRGPNVHLIGNSALKIDLNDVEFHGKLFKSGPGL